MSSGQGKAVRRYRAERDFGVVVGAVLALLGAWWLYRGKFPGVRPYFVGAGALLVVLGLAFPRALHWPNRAWTALAEALAYVMTRVVLALVYFLVVTPIGVVKRLTGWDPLSRRAPREGGSYWKPYPERQQDTRHYEKMY
jgi:hypothetical protein